jgi:cytochrome b561
MTTLQIAVFSFLAGFFGCALLVFRIVWRVTCWDLPNPRFKRLSR